MANEEDKQNLNIDFMRNYKSCGTTQDSFDQCFQLKKEKQKIQKKKAKKITFSK